MVNVPLCRGCNVPLTDEQSSDAHIIPNALGGRLAPKGVLCGLGNAALNVLADRPLVSAFGPWPTLLDIPRDRGANPPVVIETTSGQKIRQEADGTRKRVDLVYDVNLVEQGHAVQIIAPNWKLMRQRIAQASKQFVQLDPALAEANAKEISEVPSGFERVTVNFGPSEVFPGVMSALWLFCIHRTGHELMPWSKLIDLLVSIRGGGTFDGFRYLPDGLPGLIGPSIPISHKLVLRTVPAAGLLIGYVEILGALRVGGIITEGSPHHFEEHIYVADVLNRKECTAEFSIDAATFDNTDWRSIGLAIADAPSGALRQYAIDSQAPLIARKKERDIALASVEATGTIQTPAR